MIARTFQFDTLTMSLVWTHFMAKGLERPKHYDHLNVLAEHPVLDLVPFLLLQ